MGGGAEQRIGEQRAGEDLTAAHARIRDEAVRLAGGPGDMPQRVALLHSIFVDSGGNHAFPEVALHGALWAYGFYERRGAVNRMIAYRYFYDREERARRSYMLFEFSQGFKEANRSVFIDTYTNYFFSKRHGEARGGRARSSRRSCSTPSTASTTPPRGGRRLPRRGARPRSSRRRSSSSRRRRSAPRSGRRSRSSTARC